MYEGFFRGYTKKQWGRDPKDIPASVFRRLPIHFKKDANVFHHKRQGQPRDGYTRLVEKYSSTRTLISKSAAGFQGTPRVSRICSIPVSWMSISTTPMGGCRIERFALNTRYDTGRFKIAEPSTIVTKIFLTPGSSSTNIFGPGSHSPMQRWLRTNIRTSAPGMTGPTTLSICYTRNTSRAPNRRS